MLLKMMKLKNVVDKCMNRFIFLLENSRKWKTGIRGLAILSAIQKHADQVLCIS